MEIPFSVYKRDVMERLLDAMPALVVHMDTGEILLASRPLEIMFGYTIPGELLGKQIEMLLPENLREQHQEHRADFAAMPSMRPMGIRKGLKGKKKNGDILPVHILLVPFEIPGWRCVGAILSDMTGQKEQVSEGEGKRLYQFGRFELTR